ncbi:MAG: c-type cytochrome biogenesis protein CcmI [Methylobacterium sp.]|nr:c-type cytochrome biogenesis protein CcmI [Methylobacterium sp.]MCA3600583.1 c-type cytochrome biogenesis protein CcmI [Methylobacterium sp.]MCA3608815.1 c-type cytochrome biogenesis protein CcmI [Methylobacterium sp.]MCA3616675.1 c-type cytochrome biogenesis protein CcmI [Methylobacterium sp.]MCA3620355.1 c-type cytochrome biogenesis protein CcmI [Methylobacterium sp.]
MTLWFGIVILTFGAAVLALRPLLRPPKGKTSLDHAIQFYEARRLELDRQVTAGLISENERTASEAEQARRLLAIGRQNEVEQERKTGSARRSKIAALLLLIGLPVLSIALYLRTGTPDMPDQPIAGRMTPGSDAQMQQALQRIELHLASNPDDARGFEVIAPAYMRLGRYQDAAFAFRRVIAISGETPDRLANLGEALIASQNGIVNAEAKQAFEKAVALDPDFAKALFYLAIATEQDGDVPGAIRKLMELSASLPEGPGRMRVETELDRFRAEGKAPPRPTGGPQSEAGKALSELPPEERARAIEGMVDGLAARLAQQGGSLDEWQRLIQARMVLNQRDKAANALADARKALGESATAELDRLAAALDLKAANP